MRTPILALAAFVASAANAQSCVPPPQTSVVAYPRGTLIKGVGTSDVPVTSANSKCVALVKQGFALIHCFWFNEAVRSFRDATREDPSCAIAWCGLNVAENMPWNKRAEYEKEAEYAIKRAVRLWETAGPVEQELIIAFRTRDLTVDDRKGAFYSAMNELIARHPDAVEPRLLLAGIRTQICMGDRTLPNGELKNELEEVSILIAPVLSKDPRNPGALHYKIHTFEGSTPETALEAARLLSKVAPASAHMVHMPGHIFNVLGLWDEADKAFADSNRIGEAYAKAVKAKPGEADWNYGHNRDYWCVNYGEQGRLKEAFALAGGNRRREILWRVSDWKALSEAVTSASEGAETDYLTGMAAAYLGRLDAAKVALAKLKKADGTMWGNVAKWVLETRKIELEGLVLVKSGDAEGGIAKLKESLDAFARIEYEEPPYYMRPPHETLGQALIDLGRAKEAVAVYENGLKVKRNGGTMLYGIARAHEAAGNDEKARAGYVEFLKVWAKADPDRPQVVHAKAFLVGLRR